MAQARFSRLLSPGARTVSPASIAYWTSRIRCARQTVRPPDPHPRLVRSQDRAGEKPRLDQAPLGRKRRPAGVEDIDQRAFTDVEPEQVTQHAAQSCQRDALDRTQIEHEGAQVRPER